MIIVRNILCLVTITTQLSCLALRLRRQKSFKREPRLYMFNDNQMDIDPRYHAISDTERRSLGSIYSTQKITHCYRNCPVSREHLPVCGTNGVTYNNIPAFLCVRKCQGDESVDILHHGFCTLKPASLQSSHGSAPRLNWHCIDRCPISNELNPVCGSDGITYKNFAHLYCVSKCGSGVRIANVGKCVMTMVITQRPPIKTTTTWSRLNLLYAQKTTTWSRLNLLYAQKTTPTRPDPVRFTTIPSTRRYEYTTRTAKTMKPFVEFSKPQIKNNGFSASNASMEQCIDKCVPSDEYNPVCGTNNITYLNPGRLLCAHWCGVDVGYKKRGICSSVEYVYPSNLDSMYTVGYENDNSSVSNRTKCIASCPNTPDYNKVCGTNGVTYPNIVKLICVYWCGVDVRIQHLGPCNKTQQVRKATMSSKLSTKAPESTNRYSFSVRNRTNDLVRPEVTEAYTKSCMQNCGLTSVVEPVCGTNGITYINPSRLECAASCGEDVEIKGRGPCPEEIKDNNIEDSHVSIESCIRDCPVTSELNPVCGTNGVTYLNPTRLICVSNCGVHVKLLSKGSCSRYWSKIYY